MKASTNRAIHTSDHDPSIRGTKIRGVMKMLGSSKMTVNRLVIHDPEFPKPFYIGRDRIWFEHEIVAYLEKKRRTSTIWPVPLFVKGVPQPAHQRREDPLEIPNLDNRLIDDGVTEQSLADDGIGEMNPTDETS